MAEKKGLSAPQVIAAALAASSVSFISSHLSGHLNAIVLAGTVSVLSALIAEAYKKSISLTLKKVRRVDEEPDEGEVEAEAVEERSNLILKLSALFAVFSLATIGATYFLTSNSEPTTTLVEKTQVVQQVQSDASLAEKVDQATSSGHTAKQIANEAASTADEASTKAEVAVDETARLNEQIATLEKALVELKAENEALKREVEALKVDAAGTQSTDSSASNATTDSSTTQQGLDTP